MTNILSIFIVSLVIMSSFTGMSVAADPSDLITVYAADSLSNVVDNFKNIFFPKENVNATYAGSQALINDIINNNASVDVLLSADYGLIDDRLISNYTLWNGEFARNSIVIAYRRNSSYADKINDTNWYDILNYPGVKFGFGNPNLDPCGYRTMMDIALANNYYSNPSIFDNLITKNSDIFAKANADNDGYGVYSPTNANANNSTIWIDPHAADSLDRLIKDDEKNGSIDYAFVYENQAEDVRSNNTDIEYITLPPELSLNDTKYKDVYAKYSLFENYDDLTKNKTIILTPIVYGITILSKSPNPSGALDFVSKFFANEKVGYFGSLIPIFPVVKSDATDWNNIPDDLKQFFEKPYINYRDNMQGVNVNGFKSSLVNN